MRTTSQVAKLTNVSVRTLQYYDEIGLLKPSETTPSGYRLYNDEALQTLQQIIQEIIARAQKNAPSALVGDQANYCRLIIDLYSNDYLRSVFDAKNGAGSAEYVVEAFRCRLRYNNL